MKYIDYSNLRTESDLKLARQKLKYAIHIKEETLFETLGILKSNVLLSIRTTAWQTIAKLTARTVIKVLQRR
jgi:hypothetical protein